MVKRTFTNVIFGVLISQIRTLFEGTQRSVYVGCIVLCCSISWRGLTRVACPKREAMREPAHGISEK